MDADKDKITYCGLYCGDCFIYEGKLADLARDLRKELRQSKFDKTAESLSAVPFFKAFQNYQQCYETLGAMVRLDVKEPAVAEVAILPAKSEYAARRKIFLAAGNVTNLRPVPSWTS